MVVDSFLQNGDILYDVDLVTTLKGMLMRKLPICAVVVSLCLTFGLPGALALDIAQYEIVKRESPDGNGQR